MQKMWSLKKGNSGPINNPSFLFDEIVLFKNIYFKVAKNFLPKPVTDRTDLCGVNFI